MLRALQHNTTLLSLNIGNNKLEAPIGKEIRKLLQVNKTLIDLEIGWNSFELEDVREIQELLKQNKKAYDAERLKEWRERKLMKDEDTRLHELYLKQ